MQDARSEAAKGLAPCAGHPPPAAPRCAADHPTPLCPHSAALRWPCSHALGHSTRVPVPLAPSPRCAQTRPARCARPAPRSRGHPGSQGPAPPPAASRPSSPTIAATTQVRVLHIPSRYSSQGAACAALAAALLQLLQLSSCHWQAGQQRQQAASGCMPAKPSVPHACHMPADLEQGDGAGNVRGAIVGEVIPIHAGEDHIVDAPGRHSLGSVLRLVGVQRRRRARGLHRTEPAPGGAGWVGG